METRANLIIVGMFVLAVIVAGFGAVSWLLGGTRATNRAEVTIAFPGAITGLAPGAAVLFNGIRVGDVSRFEYVEDDPTQVRVIASVDNRAPIKTDSRVTLGSSALTGTASVQIIGGTREAPSLFSAGGPRQMRAETAAVQDLMDGAKQVLGKADATLSSVNQLIRDNSDSVGRTVRNVESFSDALAKNAGNVESFMASVGRAADVLTSVSGKAEGLVTHLDALVASVETDKVRAVVDNAAKVSADIARSSGELDGIVTQAKTAVDTVSKLASNADLAVGDARRIIGAVDPDKVKTTVDSVASFSQYLTGKTRDVDDIVASAKSASAHVDTFTAGLAARGDDVQAIIKDARAISGRLEEASRRVDGILAKIDGVVGSDEAQGLFAQGRGFLDEATAAAKSIRETADVFRGRANDVADGINRLTANGARDLREFVANGQRTLNSIDRAVNNLDREPQRLIFGGASGRIQDYGPGRR